MRSALQIIFIIVLAGLMAAGIHLGWWTDISTRAPLAENLWQQGLWPVQDIIAAEIKALADSGDDDKPLRIAIKVDSAAASAYRFAPLQAEDIRRIITAKQEAGENELLVVHESDQPDATATVTLRSYQQGATEDILEGTIIFDAPGKEPTETPFHAVCPASGRNWFVQTVRRIPPWIMAGAGLALLLGGIGGLRGAWRTFTGRYDCSLSMNCFTTLAAAAFLTLMLGEFAHPGYGSFGMPRWHVRLALETSDAVRFPLTPETDNGTLNDVCRFIMLCAEQIAVDMDVHDIPARGGEFGVWLRRTWAQLGRGSVRSGVLHESEGVQIVHGIPPAEPEQKNESRPVVTAASASITDLPNILGGDRRGLPPGFFLPWAGAEINAGELIVAFQTGEPSSIRQAEWLDSGDMRRDTERPEDIRVFSVLLPTLPRSDHPGWSMAARVRNLAGISDAVWITQAADNDDIEVGALDAEIERNPIFPAPEKPIEADMDVARTRLLRAANADMEETAGRLAARVRGLSDVRESAMFQTAPSAIIPALLLTAALALFLRLQRELRILDLGLPVGQHEWLGALAGLGLALGSALLLCFITAEPMRWRTAIGTDMIIWGVIMLWYAAVWLPMLIGRCLGTLPAPAEMLRVRHLAGWFAATMAIAGLAATASFTMTFMPFRPAIQAAGVQIGILVTAVFFLALALRYQWVCFWRPSRRRTWLLGLIGLLLLAGLPVWNMTMPHTGHAVTARIFAGVCLCAIALPAAGVAGIRLQYGRRGAPTVAGIGWSGLLYSLLIGIILPLILLWPIPVIP